MLVNVVSHPDQRTLFFSLKYKTTFRNSLCFLVEQFHKLYFCRFH